MKSLLSEISMKCQITPSSLIFLSSLFLSFVIFSLYRTTLSHYVLVLPLTSGLHDAAFPFQLVSPALLPRTLAIDVQTHVPLLLQVEKLLEQLSDIVVSLGRGLHESTLPGLGLGLSILGLDFPLRLVTLVPHEHDWDGLYVAFDSENLLVYGL